MACCFDIFFRGKHIILRWNVFFGWVGICHVNLILYMTYDDIWWYMKISKNLRCANPGLTVPSDISHVFGYKKTLVQARFASFPGKVLFLRVRWAGSLLGLWPLFDVWFLGRLISGSVWYRETKSMGDSCSQWIVHSYEAWQVPDERARTSAFATGLQERKTLDFHINYGDFKQ